MTRTAEQRYAVCVYCASSENIDPRLMLLAARMGAALAAANMVLVSGGGRVSCMGEVARAARAGGGRTEGVITDFLVNLEVADTDADELVITSTMRERKAEMDARSDAFVILPGGLGTLEELFEVWTTRGLGEHDRPLVVVDPTDIFGPLWAALHGLVGQGLIKTGAFAALDIVRDVPAAVALLSANRAAL